jgi:hypothetical protein
MVSFCECPKCKSKNARRVVEAEDLLLVCLCGLRQYLYRAPVEPPKPSSAPPRLALVPSEQAARLPVNPRVPPEAIKLPQRNTALWLTTVSLACLEQATSGDIAERVLDLGSQRTISDISSYLTILRSKGVVLTTEIRKGLPGGSTWILSERAKQLLGLTPPGGDGGAVAAG